MQPTPVSQLSLSLALNQQSYNKQLVLLPVLLVFFKVIGPIRLLQPSNSSKANPEILSTVLMKFYRLYCHRYDAHKPAALITSRWLVWHYARNFFLCSFVEGREKSEERHRNAWTVASLLLSSENTCPWAVNRNALVIFRRMLYGIWKTGTFVCSAIISNIKN